MCYILVNLTLDSPLICNGYSVFHDLDILEDTTHTYYYIGVCGQIGLLRWLKKRQREWEKQEKAVGCLAEVNTDSSESDWLLCDFHFQNQYCYQWDGGWW